MIKVGIIGCGKISDDHAEQVKRIIGTEIVAVCDKEEMMARQFAERFNVKKYYGNVNDLLNGTKVDVVHVTTPPQSHLEIGKLCLEAGCHVYMEKPFTINTEEAISLINIAKEKKLKITVGHDYQFTHAKRRMRELIRNGYLGGPPVHMESYHGYELGRGRYARALLGDKNHWVRNLPGTLMQNNINHGISSIAEFLNELNPKVIAYGYPSPFLKEIGETDIIGEARVIIDEVEHISAYFTFSVQMRPVLHQFRIYGPQNGLIVDHDQQTCIKIPGERRKSYLEKFISPIVFAKEYAGNSIRNISLFMKKDFHMKSGMKHLMELFYHSILEDKPVPISYDEILRTTKIIDKIIIQLKSSVEK